MPVGRRQDVELQAVFGDRAAGDPIASFLELIADMLIGKRFATTCLSGNDLSHNILHTQRRGEEVTEGNHFSRWQEQIFVRCRPADRRLIDAELCCNIAASERLQISHCASQKRFLATAHDRRDVEQCAAPLLQPRNEVACGADRFTNMITLVVAERSIWCV